MWKLHIKKNDEEAFLLHVHRASTLPIVLPCPFIKLNLKIEFKVAEAPPPQLCCVFLQNVPARARLDESLASRLLLPAWAQFCCFSLQALLCSQMGINRAKLFRSLHTNTHCHKLILIFSSLHCWAGAFSFHSCWGEFSHPPTYYHILMQLQSCSVWALRTVRVWALMNAFAGTEVMKSNKESVS